MKQSHEIESPPSKDIPPFILGLGALLILTGTFTITEWIRDKSREILTARHDLIAEKAEIPDEMRQIIPELQKTTELLISESGKLPPIRPVEIASGIKGFDRQDPIYKMVEMYTSSKHPEWNLNIAVGKTRLKIAVEGFLETLGAQVTPCSSSLWRIIGSDREIHEGSVSHATGTTYTDNSFVKEHFLEGLDAYQVDLGGEATTFIITPTTVWALNVRQDSFVSACVGLCPDQISDIREHYLGPMDPKDVNIAPLDLFLATRAFMNGVSSGKMELSTAENPEDISHCDADNFYTAVSNGTVGDTGYPIRPSY